MIALQALLLVLCGLGIGWVLGRRPDPTFVAQLDTLRSANRQLDSTLAAWQAAGPSRDTVIVRHRAAAAQHDTVTVQLIDSVMLAAPDTLVPVLARIRVEHLAAVADLTTALDTTTAQLARAETLLARSEQLRAANLALAQACAQSARPGLLGRALATLPWLGAAYLAGRLSR
jgi:hypothetical protein